MSRIYDLTSGSIFKKIFTIALPVLLTSISQMAYNLTDMFWIGQVDEIGFSEPEALSAIGTAGYILWFAFGIILIAKIGISVKVSHHAGVQDFDGIRSNASNGMILMAAMGILTSLIIVGMRHPLIAMFRLESANVYTEAVQYLSITGGFYFVVFLINGFTSINEGLGKTALNMKILPIGLALNMILDPLMILTFRMGILGAAWATVISQAVTLSVFVFLYARSHQKIFSFHRDAFRWKTTKELLRIGFPVGLQSMFMTTFSTIIGIMAVSYGDSVFAGQRVGSQIEQFTWMIAGGFQTALTVFVGQNFGAKNGKRIRKGTVWLSAILIPYSLVVAAAFVLFPEMLIRIFLNNDEETIRYGAEYLRIISFSQLFMMLEGIGAGLFNGIGKTKIPSISGIIGNVIRVPLALWLSVSMAQRGIWWSLNISDGFKGIFLLLAGIIALSRIDKIINRPPKTPLSPALSTD
ncbi:MAG TPA: MATE family efflux transporter [Candidatus Izemoplasmatales bacterium]|nr:MATE family efflux transporter [Candidatus Izemoplasmatales bacterium]